MVYWPSSRQPPCNVAKFHMGETWGRQMFPELQIHASDAEFTQSGWALWISSWLRSRLWIPTQTSEILKGVLFIYLYQTNRSYVEASPYRLQSAFFFLQLLQNLKQRVEKFYILRKNKNVLEKTAMYLILPSKESTTN